MDGRGGCCIVRYTSGYDMSKMDRIMLRFRPIAPKPAADGGVPDGSAAEGGSKIGARRRRRYVRHNKNNNNNNNNNKRVKKKRKGGEAASAPPFLSEIPCQKEPPTGGFSPVEKSVPVWLSFGSETEERVSPPEKVPPPTSAAAVESWVRVESVTDAWVGHEFVLGCTDNERIVNLGCDTCPGFVSDSLDKVVWNNKAYEDVIGQGEKGGGETAAAVVVKLVVKEGLRLPDGAFTCQVRVVTCVKGKRRVQFLPCDTWRMEGGGFAWRLDTTAALSLGR